MKPESENIFLGAIAVIALCFPMIVIFAGACMFRLAEIRDLLQEIARFR